MGTRTDVDDEQRVAGARLPPRYIATWPANAKGKWRIARWVWDEARGAFVAVWEPEHGDAR